MKAAQQLRQQVGGRWQRLAPRERLWVGSALALLALAAGWWLLVAPALATLRQADAQHRLLDAQLKRMLDLRAQARGMQAQPRQNPDDAQRALEASVRQTLGASSRITVAGDRVTLTLTGAAPDTLAQWLTQARVNARAVPREARLTRNPAGQWDGTVVLSLPAR